MSWPAKGQQLEQQEMRRLCCFQKLISPFFLRGRNHLGSELCNMSVPELESPADQGAAATGNSSPLAHGIPLQRGHEPPSARN